MVVKLSTIKPIPMTPIRRAKIFDFKGFLLIFRKKIEGRTNTSIVEAVAPSNKQSYRKVIMYTSLTNYSKDVFDRWDKNDEDIN